MASRTLIDTYKALRTTPMWKLISGRSAPVTIGLLQHLLYDRERTLPASVFIEGVASGLTDYERTTVTREAALAYAGGWVKEGYIVCRLPAGAEEEVYELTSAGLDAIRFLSRYRTRRAGPTESRLDLVTHAIVKLANDADTDPEERIARLEAEKRRIDEEIEAIRAGRTTVLTEETAKSRIVDILDLFYELRSDFRRVREEFERLNRDFRARIMEAEGPRGETLGRFFLGYDAIRDSDAGKAFEGFYRLLTDPRAMAELQDAVDRIRDLDFFESLPPNDRELLTGLQTELLNRARETRGVMIALARSLREFVERNEYREERRLTQLIRKAQTSAHALIETVRQTKPVLDIPMTSCEVSSIGMLELDDPSLSRVAAPVEAGEAPEIDVVRLAARIRESDIDYPALKRAVRRALTESDRVTVGDVIGKTEDLRGLATVVGLLTLAARYGEPELDPDAEFLAFVTEGVMPQPQALPTDEADADDESVAANAGTSDADTVADEPLGRFSSPQADRTEAAREDAYWRLFSFAPEGDERFERALGAGRLPEGAHAAFSPSDGSALGEEEPKGFRSLADFLPYVASAALEHVAWTTRKGDLRSARIPKFWFTGESLERMRRSRGLR